MPDLLSGLAFYVVFLLSTVLHEGAHAWAALRGGDPTAYHGGQVTLNPDEVDISLKIGSQTFGIPFLASAMDGVVDPKFINAPPKRRKPASDPLPRL